MATMKQKLDNLDRIRVSKQGKVVPGDFSNESEGTLYEWNPVMGCYYTVSGAPMTLQREAINPPF